MATIISIHRVHVKHGPPEPLDAATFITDFGMEGDARSRKGRGRQITFIEEEALAFVAGKIKLATIPPGASRRQIVVRGIRLNETVGKQLRAGKVLIQVDGLCDPCKKMETAIAPGAWWAMEQRGGIIGRILKGGEMKVGDTVEIVSLVSERNQSTLQ
jgi:MOSC domain-containing protein YiiM